MVGPGKPIDTEPLPRHLRQRHRRLHGLDRAGEPRRPTARRAACAFPVITIRDMVRAQVALLDALGIERLHAVVGGSMGGMQALQPRRQFPRARRARCWRSPPRRAIRRRTSPSTRSAARRSWPIPNWQRGRLLRQRQGARRGPRGRADGGAHHISLRSRADREVRPPAAGPRRQELRLRRRLPGRKLPAPPGDRLHRPVRRQLLPLYHPRDGLLRPRRGARRAARRRLRRHHARGSAWSASTPTGSIRPPNRARSSTRSTPPPRRSASSS